MTQHKSITNLVLVLSLLAGLAFACGSGYPPEQVVIALVKRDISNRVGYALDIKDVKVIGTNQYWEEYDAQVGIRRIYPVYVEVTTNNHSSPSRYKCQFHKDTKSDEWILGYVGDVEPEWK